MSKKDEKRNNIYFDLVPPLSEKQIKIGEKPIKFTKNDFKKTEAESLNDTYCGICCELVEMCDMCGDDFHIGSIIACCDGYTHICIDCYNKLKD